MTNILTSSLWCCFQTTAAYFKQDYVCEGFFSPCKIVKIILLSHVYLRIFFFFSFKYNRVTEFWVEIFSLKTLLISMSFEMIDTERTWGQAGIIPLYVNFIFPAWMSLKFLLIHVFKFHQAL